MERKITNNCFDGYIKPNFGGSSGFTARLSDPGISKKANRESDSAFKNYVETILMDSNLTMKQKAARIRAKKEDNNSRYSLVTGKSMTIEGRQLGASARLKTSDIISMFAKNCQQQYDSVPNERGKSPREIANQLKEAQISLIR